MREIELGLKQKGNDMGMPILCLDFDGVIHSYTSGWQGAAVIPDPPVPGALEFIKAAQEHFTVAIFSSRSHQENGIGMMQVWLSDHCIKQNLGGGWIQQIEWPTHKPSAMITIDDRAITFTGEWPTMDALKSFKPWNKK